MNGPEKGHFEPAGGRVPPGRTPADWNTEFDATGEDGKPASARNKLTPAQREYIEHIKSSGLV